MIRYSARPASRATGRPVVAPIDVPVALPHQPFDLGRLASLGVRRVRMAAVDALFAETGALPDQVVDGALQLGDAILEIADGRAGFHGSSGNGGATSHDSGGCATGRTMLTEGAIYKYKFI